MLRSGHGARPVGEVDAFQPWSMLDFYQHRKATRCWYYDASSRKYNALLERLDPISPGLIGGIFMQAVRARAPWWCLHSLAMAMCRPGGGQGGPHRADEHHCRKPTLHVSAREAVAAGERKGRPSPVLNHQMTEIAKHLIGNNMFIQVSRKMLQDGLDRNYGGASELTTCWDDRREGNLTSLFLVEKDKNVRVELEGGRMVEMPVLRVICDARAPNSWTTEPSGFQLFSLLSLLQEVSNVMQRCNGEWYAASLDFRHMFFQIPLPPQLAVLFPLMFGDDYLLPRAFPMGWKCSPLVAQALTWALVARAIDGRAPKWFRFEHRAEDAFGGGTPRFLHLYNDANQVVGAVFVLLDNVFIVGNDKEIVKRATAHLRTACKECHVIIKGEGMDVGGKEVADDEITTMKEGSTIDFTGITFGFNHWHVSAKAFGKLVVTLPEEVSYRMAAGVLGCGMWDKRVRLVDMLLPENRKFMQLYGRVVPPSGDGWDNIMDLTTAERRVLQLNIDQAREKAIQGCLPLWEAPTIKDVDQYQVWACDAAGGPGKYRVAAFLGERVLLDGKLDDAQMWCEPTTDPRIEVEELHAVLVALEAAALMPGWAQVKLVIIVEDNTTAEAWLDRGYTDSDAAVPILKKIFALLTPARRLTTVGVDTTVQFADVGTRGEVQMDDESRPRCGWDNVDQAATRFENTQAAARRSFGMAALAQQLGLPSRVSARPEEK